MRKWMKVLSLLSILVVISVFYTGFLYAQCYGSLNLPADYFKYNYVVRLAVHFGDVSSLPEDVICSRHIEQGESPIEVPIYFYNAYSGIMGIKFALESCDSIVSFLPQNEFVMVYSSKEKVSGYYHMNLKVESGTPVCGPALVGYAYIIPSGDNDPVWINIVENTSYGGIYASDQYGNNHYAFSPHHGGYVGSNYLYTCQNPMCEEPNLPVIDLQAEPGYANSVKLSWIAGEGDHTIIRYSTDSFPRGFGDGEPLVNIATTPGEFKQYTQTNPPQEVVIYYTAFSVTSVSDEVIKSSFVECSATDTTLFAKPISSEMTTWGAIKSKMK